MIKRNRGRLLFIFYFAAVHLVLFLSIVPLWGKYVVRNAVVLRPTAGNEIAETLLTWVVNILEFPLVSPTVPAQDWFHRSLEAVFGGWQFLLLPLNSLLWALAASAVWYRFKRGRVPCPVPPEAEGEAWPPAPKG